MFSETIPSSVKGMFYLPGMVALRDPSFVWKKYQWKLL